MNTFERNFRALGTEIGLKLVIKDLSKKEEAEADFQCLVDEYGRLEKIFSRFDPKSDLNRLNGHLNEFQEVPPELTDVANLLLDYYKKSEGLFDPRIIGVLEKSGYNVDFHGPEFPKTINVYDAKSFEVDLIEDIIVEGRKLKFRTRMDLAGIAKGYITDRSVSLLRRKGWTNFLLDSGGDMYLAGCDEKGKKWKIEVEGFPEGKMVMELTDQAIATSGISRRQWTVEGKRYHHLIDPRAPEKYSFDIKSASAIAPTVEIADFWAKCLFLLGRERGLAKCRAERVPGLFLTYRSQLFISDEVKKYLPKEYNESVMQ